MPFLVRSSQAFARASAYLALPGRSRRAARVAARHARPERDPVQTEQPASSAAWASTSRARDRPPTPNALSQLKCVVRRFGFGLRRVRQASASSLWRRSRFTLRRALQISFLRSLCVAQSEATALKQHSSSSTASFARATFGSAFSAAITVSSAVARSHELHSNVLALTAYRQEGAGVQILRACFLCCINCCLSRSSLLKGARRADLSFCRRKTTATGKWSEDEEKLTSCSTSTSSIGWEFRTAMKSICVPPEANSFFLI